MSKLDKALVGDYNLSRTISDPRYLCHAPFSNMYFNVIGEAAPCWLTFYESPKYPEKSIREIWFGEYFENIRNQIKEFDLSGRCRVCERNIKNRLFLNPLAKAYDNEYALIDYPQIMEFELSNQCNLECVMCNGRLSSSIRQKRDQLSPQTSPYDSGFVEQLSEFLPHLKEARFNGGEPFLQPICWDIWNKIANENPKIEITVATNGTVWSSKVENILSKARFRINLSLDGISDSTYESIRKNSKFDRVMENVKKFGTYCRENNRIFSIMINPMRSNWHELPQMVEFCNSNGYYLWFNTVYRPFHLSLWNMPSSQLRVIFDQLLAHEFKQTKGEFRRLTEGNIVKFRNLIEGQIATWIKEQVDREARGTDDVSEQKKRNESKKILREKVIAHLNGEQSRMDLFWKKIEALYEKVSRNLSESSFFTLLLDKPIDWTLHDLEHKSVEQMIQELYAKAEYY